MNDNILGVDYYPEQWDSNLLDADLDNILQLGANTIRIGEFAWHIMEPIEGKYDFSFFDNVIEKAKDKGLNIIFGTPTATMPAWVADKYPYCVSEFDNGQKRSFGGRRVYCFNSEKYKSLTTQIVTALIEHYKNEESIIAWQIDNELGHEGSDICFCDNCKIAFRQFLQEKYCTIDSLNEIWGTVFWNLTYNSFDEIPLPKPTITTHNPSMKLDWEQFRSRSIENYIELQYKILRSNLENTPVIHDFSGGFFDKSVDFSKLANHIDVAAYNNYPVWGGQKEPIAPHEIACMLDYIRGLKGKNFWITEAIMGAQGHDVIGYLPRPNQGKMWSYQSVAHGASALIYFRYRAATKGAEQFCYGIIDSDNKKKRKFYEVMSFFKAMKENPAIMQSEVKSSVAVVYDFDSYASFRGQRQSEAFDNKAEIFRFYKPFYNRNINIDVISSDKDFSTYKVLLIPSMIIYKKDVFERIKRFVQDGGTVIFGFRTFLKDNHNNLVLGEELPLYSTDFVGAYVEEIEALAHGQSVPIISADGEIGSGTVFRDMLRTTTADVLNRYSDDFYSDMAAVTVNAYGSGSVYYIATALNDASLQLIADNVLDKCGIPYTQTPDGVEICTKTYKNKAVIFIINHNGYDVMVENRLIEAYGVSVVIE